MSHWIFPTVLTASLAFAVSVHGQVGQVPAFDPTLQPTIVADPGQVIPGSTVGVLASVQEITVDSTGALIARGLTDQGVGILMVDFEAFGIDTAQKLFGDEVLNGIGPSLAASASGHVAYRAQLELTYDEAIVIDDRVVMTKGELINTPGVPSQAVLAGVKSVTMNDNLTIVALIEYQLPFALGVALLQLQVNAAGQILSSKVIVRPGQTVAGLVVAQIGDAKGRSIVLTQAGDVAYLVRAVGTPIDRFLVGNQLLLADGDASPLPGGLGVNLVVAGSAKDSEVDMTSNGSWAAKVRDLQFGSPDMLLHDGALVAAEGDMLPGSSDPVQILGAPMLGDNGNVLYRAGYVPSTPISAIYALYLNDRPLVGPGSVIGSRIVASVAYPFPSIPMALGQAPYAMDDAGETVYASVVFTNGEWAVLRYDIGPWVSEGAGLVGSGMKAWRLTASGPLVPGTTTRLAVVDGEPDGSFALVIGLSLANLPFHGGILCPTADVVLVGLPLDANGSWQISSPWPPGTPAGLPTWWQAWQYPFGLYATNCLRGTSN